MSYTQEQIDNLKDAYAEGITKVTYNGRTIEYDSPSEMRKKIIEMENSLSASTKTDSEKAHFTTYSRGY